MDEQTLISNCQFDEYIVAYIDLLGTEEEIKNNSRGHFELLKSLFKETDEFIKNTNGCGCEFCKSFSQLGFKIFSDNIVVFTKKYNSEPLVELATIMRWVSHFQASALAKGLLTRGGIVQGEFCEGEFSQGKSFVYGKALLDAVNLEKGSAIYPRVVLSPDLPRIACDPPVLGSDGLYFVHYFPKLYFKMNGDSLFAYDTDTRERVLKLRDYVLSLHSKEKEAGKSTKVLQKYLWLISEYNNYCKWLKELSEKEGGYFKLNNIKISLEGCHIDMEKDLVFKV